MLIWKGRGIFVPLLIMFILLIGSIVFDVLFGERFYGTHPWAQVVTAAVAGAACFFWGKKLNTPQPERVLVDPKTRESFILKPTIHSFFYIPVEYWGAIAFFGLSFLALNRPLA